ncbi:GAF domain-containing protein [Magnetospirillum moscoviense]|nr:GAF domain-containing protein [Magnetospirillum moscoviense]
MPENESRRLAALDSYRILDTEFEDSFDRIARVAARLFDVPIALITLIDAKRQWFKAAVGVDIRETPRDESFCTCAILEPEILEVLDPTHDPRFCDSLLVTGPPNIAFYAGAPIITPDGFSLGTVCVIDRSVRPPLDQAGKLALKDLAEIVVDLLEWRKARFLASKNSDIALVLAKTCSHFMPRHVKAEP